MRTIRMPVFQANLQEFARIATEAFVSFSVSFVRTGPIFSKLKGRLQILITAIEWYRCESCTP